MNTTDTLDDPYPFEDFAPTLSQCFVIVIVGYLMARFELLTSSDVKGVIAFASNFAMPGIICVSLADADFDDFRWELIVGIFIGKFIIFVFVAGFLLLLDSNIGVAGAVAIFCVQSNDLPVGNPLMSSLYRNYRPQMMKYLFLIPAMTIIFFVPVSNIMISMHRTQRNEALKLEDSTSTKYLLKNVYKRENLDHIRGLVKNPVVIATALGLILNFSFKGSVPENLHQPINVAAATIPGIALAMLGFSFVRKERYLISSAVVPAMVLLILKMVLTPVLLHALLRILTEESTSSKLLSDFSLLYGIISPATAIFQSGQEFRKSLAVMSVALFLTSFSCFPVSYIVARITIAPVQKLSCYIPQLKQILFWTACASIISDVVVWIMMIWKKQWNQAHYCYITYLVFTQCITSCGVLFWSLTRHETWTTYCQIAFYYGGEISGYLWTGTIALVLIFKEKYSMLAEKEFSILSFMVFSISALLTTVMCLLVSHNEVQGVDVIGRVRSNLDFQLLMTTITLFISLVVVTVCLICHFKRGKNQREITDVYAYDNTIFFIQEQEEEQEEDSKDYIKKDPLSSAGMQERFGERDEAKFYYQDVLRKSGCEISLPSSDREWTCRLTSLLLLQGLVMFVKLIANLFKLVRSKALEVMVPMEFLQSVLFIGQGIFLLLIFGVDIRTATISVRKWWRRIRTEADGILSTFANLDTKGEIAQCCSQFYKFYFNRCFRDLARERRWKDTVYKDSFWGHQLVDWMISEGLCKDDVDAEELGQKLLAGNVFRHVAERHQFHDAPYLYYFVRWKTVN